MLKRVGKTVSISHYKDASDNEMACAKVVKYNFQPGQVQLLAMGFMDTICVDCVHNT